MASSDNENHASEIVIDLEIIQEEEEVPLAAAAGGGEEATAAEAGHLAAGVGGGGEGATAAETEGEEEATAAQAEGEADVAGGENNNLRLEENDECWRYIPLLKVALKGEWESAKRIFDQDEGALTAKITRSKETALHVAIGSGRSIDFVKKLVDLMSAEALALPDNSGLTALHWAAYVGNTKAAVILVRKHSALLYICDNNNNLPHHRAAKEAHKDTLLYLLCVTRADSESMPFADPSSSARLLNYAIDSNFYDIALNLVDRYPQSATTILDNGEYALGTLSFLPSAFRSGSRLNYWQRLIYSYVPVKLENYAVEDYDRVSQKLQVMLWKVLELLAPLIKRIREQKLMHLQALQLVKCLCEKIISLNDSNTYASFYREPILTAARLGIHEVVEVIVESFPEAFWSVDSENDNIFQLAVLYRNENVFNLNYQMSEYRRAMLMLTNDSYNTILHLVGRLAPHDKLNLIPNAALQMQRELQWFKEVEKFIMPSYKDLRNNKNETPAMVFTREHKELVKEGEKWVKDTANSCTIAAALIATIAFAASITVPGGNNGTSGLPIFLKESAFIVFVVSNAISLFTSTTSLLVFLSILTSTTSRFAEGDFLYILPKRLIIGHFTLFLSIVTMIVAFSSIIYLVVGQNKAWILILVVSSACLPITFFISLQFPVLVYLFSSTYGRGIFGKQSDRPFY